MEVSQVENWQTAWIGVAQESGGAVWDSLLTKWTKHQRLQSHQQSWQQKHHPAAMAAKQRAAEECAFRLTGGRPVSIGKYACPHCFDPPVVMAVRSLQKHVVQCRDLPEEVRRRQAHQRGQPHTRFRLTGKQPAPSATPHSTPTPQPKPKAARQPRPDHRIAADALGPDPGRKRRMLTDWIPADIRAAYKRRFPLRQMTLTDLPVPHPPEGLHPQTCMFCNEHFDSVTRCSKHSLCCHSMPFDEWIRRVRICQYDHRGSPYVCPRCGTSLPTPKSRGKHTHEGKMPDYHSTVAPSMKSMVTFNSSWSCGSTVLSKLWYSVRPIFLA